MIRALLAIVAAALVWSGASRTALAAGESADPTPLLLPRAELLAHLPGGRDWALVPLADFHALTDRAHADPQALPPRGDGALAWVEAARLSARVRIADDGRHLADLAVESDAVSTSDASAPCVLSREARFPSALITVDDRPAPLIASLDAVLLRGRGRHRVRVAWSALGRVDQAGFSWSLPAPDCPGVELRCATDQGGTWSARTTRAGSEQDEPVALAPGASAWQGALAGGSRGIALSWTPGAPASGPSHALGVSSTLVVGVDRERRFRWTVALSEGGGAAADGLAVELPAGWHLDQPEAGQARIGAPLAAGGRAVMAVPEAGGWRWAGWLEPGAAIDLPRVVAAVHQEGEVALVGDAAAGDAAWTTPASWRAIAPRGSAVGGADGEGDADDGTGGEVAGPDARELRRYAVAAPGDPLSAPLPSPPEPSRSTSAVRVAIGERRWRLDQRCVCILGDVRQALALRLPAGWRVLAVQLDAGARHGGAPAGDRREIDPGEAVDGVLRCPLPRFSRPGDRATVDLVAERDAGAGWSGVPLATIDAVIAGETRVDVAAQPGLALELSAGPGWRAGENPAGDARATFLGLGAPSALTFAAHARGWDGDAEAVLYLLARDGDPRARLDLRLRARDGAVSELRVSAPFAAGGAVTGGDGVQVERAGERWRVRFAEPWRGERLLRLEGPLASGELPRVALDAPLVQTIAVQAADEVEPTLRAAADALAVGFDELPAWSAAIPGAPLVEAVRLPSRGGALGTLGVAPRILASGPTGFVDALELSAQLAPGAARMLVRGRVCAPGLAGVPIALPDGWRLLQATIDGHGVGVRRTGASWWLPLPGRSHAQLALVFAADGLGERITLRPPSFGAVPLLGTRWRLAADGDVRLTPEAGSPVVLVSPTAVRRAAWGEWSPAREVADPSPPSALSAAALVQRDPRELVPLASAPPPVGEPTLALIGQRWSGEHGGDALALTVRLTPIARLGRIDALARVAGMLAALGLAALLAWRAQALIGLAALATVAGAIAAQRPCGPLLGLAEGLAPALAVALLARLLARALMRAGATGAALTVLVALLLPLAGSPLLGEEAATPSPAPLPLPYDGDLRWMGYDALGPDGAPRGVVVALPRERLVELEHGRTADAGPALAAVGAASVRVRIDGGRAEGATEVPLVAIGHGVAELMIELPGRAGEITFAPAAGAAATAPTWRSTARGTSAAIPAGCAGVATVAWTAEVLRDPGAALGWSIEHLQPGESGATLRIDAPADALLDAGPEARLVADGAAAGGRRQWSATGAERLRWRGAGDAAGAGPPPLAVQDIAVTAHPAWLAWNDALSVTVRAAALRGCAIALPDGVRLGSVEADRPIDWNQDGATATVSWREPLRGAATLRLRGALPIAVADGAADLAARLLDGEDGGGRLALHHGGGLRFQPPADAGRLDPAAGEDLAARWSGGLPALRVSWAREARALTAETRVELLAGRERVRIQVEIALHGRGEADALVLALPPPWRVVSGPHAVVGGDGAARRATLRESGPWRDGMRARLLLEAERAALLDAGDELALPELTLSGEIADERQDWVVGDAGDRRASLAGAVGVRALPLADAAPSLALAPGETWRQAFTRRPGAALPRLRLAREASDIAVDADHYLVLRGERVRWFARLTFRPLQGEIARLACALPHDAAVVAVSARGLGRWSRDGDRLAIELAAPTRAAVVLALELDLPLGPLPALAVAAPAHLAQTRIALVEADRVGYLRIAADGLAPIGAEALAGGVPAGVDPALVARAWRAERADWTLGLSRAAAAIADGPDGVASLADVTVAFAADGSRRGRAVWHVLDRTRRQVPLLLPPGAQLWELRVDGRVVRAREEPAHPGQALIPMRLVQAGETSTRVAVVWHQAADAAVAAGGEARVDLPSLEGVRVATTLVEVVAPPAWRIARERGDARAIARGEADALRARRVGEELARLRAVDPAALADGGERLLDQIAALDGELDDHVIGLARAGGEALAEAQAARAALREHRARVARELAEAQVRRAGLGLDALALGWAEPVGEAPDAGYPAPPAALAPWTATPGLSAGALGPGAPAADADEAGGGPPGLDLFALPDGARLRFADAGADPELSVRLSPPRGGWAPWAAFGLAIALAAVGLAQRRARG